MIQKTKELFDYKKATQLELKHCKSTTETETSVRSSNRGSRIAPLFFRDFPQPSKRSFVDSRAWRTVPWMITMP